MNTYYSVNSHTHTIIYTTTTLSQPYTPSYTLPPHNLHLTPPYILLYTPTHTSHNTSYNTSHNTSHTTSHYTSHYSPHNTSHTTSHYTSYYTPHTTSHLTHSTTHNTSHTTLHTISTPHIHTVYRKKVLHRTYTYFNTSALAVIYEF